MRMEPFRHLSWRTFGLLLLAGMVFWSCENGDDPGSAPTFSVHFANVDTDSLHLWVMLHNLSGDTVLAVRKVGHSGVADFGPVYADRITCTIIQRGQQQIFLNTYRNVPGGEWNGTWFFRPSESIGTADVRLNYTPASNLLLDRSEDGGGYNGIILFPGELYHYITPVYRLDQGGFSLYARVYNDTSSLCGWLLRAPFQLQETNHYTLDLTAPTHYRTLALNRQCRSVSVLAKISDDFGAWSRILASEADPLNYQFPDCGFPAEELRSLRRLQRTQPFWWLLHPRRHSARRARSPGHGPCCHL